jgi:hypothetical protein
VAEHVGATINVDRGSQRRPGRSAATGGVVASGVAVVEFDLFLADLAPDGLLVGDGLLAQADSLDRDGFGVDHGSFGQKVDLVLLFGDRRVVVASPRSAATTAETAGAGPPNSSSTAR